MNALVLQGYQSPFQLARIAKPRCEAGQVLVRIGASASTIQGTPRTGPMPHNGYRAFGIAACQRAFPDFIYTSIEDGLSRSRIS